MPKNFMDNNFLLNSVTAQKLFHDCAASLPIYDYHCHLNPQAIYDDIPFKNIADIFLGGDHYKWRFMRSCGIPEEYITGSAKPYDKFKMFIKALQYGIGNPLYHWTHLELKRYFNADETVNQNNTNILWEKCNKVIEETQMRPSTLINSSNVAVICTTDDPCDTLEYHSKIKEKGHINAKVLPTFRPDFAINIDKPTFNSYIKKLENAAGIKIRTYSDLLCALKNRVEFFHSAGCRISDHALDSVPFATTNENKANEIFTKALSGIILTSDEIEKYKSFTLTNLGAYYRKLDWAMQIHIGAQRNNNTNMFNKLGADTGFDSISDYAIAAPLSKLLDSMELKNQLPKTILYTLNPKDNYTLGTMIGNFQSDDVPGKIQFGSGWWFNDQKDGMLQQMQALANLGALNTFIGMLTDSRSFLSYTRHEYFRRILCNLLGDWVENGEFPADMDTLKNIVEGICFNNAKQYFSIEI